MAIDIALMAVSTNEKTRYILLIPAMVLFYSTLILFSVEYDSLMMKQWKRSEEKVKKEAYISSFIEYLKEKKPYMVKD
jgi:hypothetical protein